MVCHHIRQSSGSSTQSPNSGQVPDFGRKKFAIEGERKPSALIAVGFLQRNAGDDASCANPSTSAAATLSGDSHAFRGWRSGGGTTRRMFHRAIPTTLCCTNAGITQRVQSEEGRRQSAGGQRADLRASVRWVEAAFVADRSRNLVSRPSAALRVRPPR